MSFLCSGLMCSARILQRPSTHAYDFVHVHAASLWIFWCSLICSKLQKVCCIKPYRTNWGGSEDLKKLNWLFFLSCGGHVYRGPEKKMFSVSLGLKLKFKYLEWDAFCQIVRLTTPRNDGNSVNWCTTRAWFLKNRWAAILNAQLAMCKRVQRERIISTPEARQRQVWRRYFGIQKLASEGLEAWQWNYTALFPLVSLSCQVWFNTVCLQEKEQNIWGVIYSTAAICAQREGSVMKVVLGWVQSHRKTRTLVFSFSFRIQETHRVRIYVKKENISNKLADFNSRMYWQQGLLWAANNVWLCPQISKGTFILESVNYHLGFFFYIKNNLSSDFQYTKYLYGKFYFSLSILLV